MTDRLKGKRAIVTAAAQGIGHATALAFAREGAEVVATDLNGAKLAELDGIPSIETRQLDVLDAQAIAAFAQDIGRPDILFNCAGFVHAGTILDCTEEEFDFAFALNVKSMFRMVRTFLPWMIDGGGGSIVNIASVASSVIAAPNRFAYGASKAAVVGLTKSVAADFVSQGVRANAICPGTVESPSLEDRMRATGDLEAARRAFAARQPMGRLGRPEEIASLAVYLASPEAAFVTGQAISIDGGWTNI
ncbi:SDR family oxidoreductase [Aureimonas sp. ME7]|uniref:SDR family oxidoreductase n=1 Tax=Aureimonas sp. ME7 TaxID=2744252 RepID=UPI0015F6755E|nr:SDR family oxidoreductase [Aureimonas sp. ME7]